MGLNNLKSTENKRKLILSIIKISILGLIIIGIPLYIFIFHREFLLSFKNLDEVVKFLKHYEGESMLVCVGAQILQIVISFLPGQVFQMAAGYLYGISIALLISVIGAIIGTVISFLLAKVLGRDFLHLLFGEEKMQVYIEKLNSKKAYVMVFLIYLIPGVPKDMVSYAAGVSEINFKAFLILSTLGRLPGMTGSLLIGYFLEQKNYIVVAIIGVLAVMAFLLCIIFRKRINTEFDKIYEKMLAK